MSDQDPQPVVQPSASTGIPGGRSPSGADSPGSTPADSLPAQGAAVSEGSADADGEGSQRDRQVPGQPPGTADSPVPSPGDVPGASLPGVAAGQGASPADGIELGDKAPGASSSTVSPGSLVSLGTPGHPDGEVATGTQ